MLSGLNIPKKIGGLVERRRESVRQRKALVERGHRSAVSIVEERLRSDEGFEGFIRGELKRSNELVDTRRNLELELMDLIVPAKKDSSPEEPKLIKSDSLSP
jgi:hypothetical protein